MDISTLKTLSSAGDLVAEIARLETALGKAHAPPIFSRRAAMRRIKELGELVPAKAASAILPPEPPTPDEPPTLLGKLEKLQADGDLIGAAKFRQQNWAALIAEQKKGIADGSIGTAPTPERLKRLSE